MQTSWDVVTEMQGWPPAVGKFVRVTFDIASAECVPAALTAEAVSHLTSNIPWVGTLVSYQFSKSSQEIIQKNAGYGVIARIYMPLLGVGVAYNKVQTKRPTESMVPGPFSDLMIEKITYANYQELDGAGWHRLIVDLNMGAGGPFLYLKCKPHSEGDAGSISDILVLNSKNKNIATPAGYTKVPTDLNAGVKGDYIYLYFKRGGTAIKGLAVVAGDTSQTPAPAGFAKIGCDLNKGAKGKYVYLCYQPA